MTPTTLKMLQPDDVAHLQGLIISGYGDLPFAYYIFLRFTDAPASRQWLDKTLPFITSAQRKLGADGEYQKELAILNLAFSATGLAALELPDLADQFPEEFLQNMGEPFRARRLGDVGPEDPNLWEIGRPPREGVEPTGPSEPLHALLIIQARYKPLLDSVYEEQINLARKFGVHQAGPAHFGCQENDSKEHFGFVDGVSQPFIENSPAKKKDRQPSVRAGEFILGYHNESGILPASPSVPECPAAQKHLPPSIEGSRDFGCNGTFLVFRKLYQHVATFRKFVHESAGTPQERLHNAACIIGRWPDGSPLPLSPNGEPVPRDKQNNFYYRAADPAGLACPLGSHIRRSNPRDSLAFNANESLLHVNRHRLIRRGARYGAALPDGEMTDDGKDRGLFFICLNADIMRQFEFVQQTWVANPKFNALYNDADPLLGPEGRDLTIQACPVRPRHQSLPRFVTLKGGGYFFLPSLPALRYLAEYRPEASGTTN